MSAINLLHHRGSQSVCTDLIQMIHDGLIRRLKRFVVEPFDDGVTWGIQTVAIAVPENEDGDKFPIVIVDLHEDDQAAMSFALSVFDALRIAGRATSEDVCQWRRSLFAVVPKD
ncbi:hypothetical protein QZH44_29740 (plasmid) [Pseudomonas corrugata]|uniref:hypothetical protein n=1 Tax=Pseudomonas corrugata TaxID=47879 RepID=UPI003D812E01